MTKRKSPAKAPSPKPTAQPAEPLLGSDGRPTGFGMEVLSRVVRQRVGNYLLKCTGPTDTIFNRNMQIVDVDSDGSDRIVARFSSKWLCGLVETHSFQHAADALWTYVNSRDNLADLESLR